MKRARALSRVLAVVVIGALAGAGRADEAEPIAGNVLDAQGAPIAGASVRLIPLPLPGAAHLVDADLFSIESGTGWDANAPSALSDGTGRFAIRAPADSMLFHVVATANGYAPCVLPHVTTRTVWELRLDQGYVLTGHVRRLDGSAVAGALLTYRTVVGEGRYERRGTTGEDGSYLLANLPFATGDEMPEEATLEVRARDCAPQVRPVALGRSRPIEGVERHRRELDVYLARGAILQGLVKDAVTEKPIAGARVVVYSSEQMAEWSQDFIRRDYQYPFGMRIVAEGTTDADGEYRIEHIPVEVSGIHLNRMLEAFEDFAGGVLFMGEGYAPGDAGFPMPREDGAQFTVNGSLTPAAVLEGRVVDASGNARAGVWVSVVTAFKEIEAAAPIEWLRQLGVCPDQATDADGRFRISVVPCPGGKPRSVEVSVSGILWDATSRSVDIDPGKITTMPDWLLERVDRHRAHGMNVVGTVHNTDGSPIHGAWVEVISTSTNKSYTPPRITGRDGWFGVREIGDSVLRVSRRGFATVSLPLAGIKRPKELSIILAPEQSLSGVVADAGGAGVQGVGVYAFDRHIQPDARAMKGEGRVQGAVAHAITDATGRFTLRGLTEGEYDLFVSETPARNFLKPIFATEAIRFLVPGVKAGETDVRIALPAEYKASRHGLTVWLRDPEGRPVNAEQHSVSLGFKKDGGLELQAFGEFVGPGRWELFDVPAGEYSLRTPAGSIPVTIGPTSERDLIVRVNP